MFRNKRSIPTNDNQNPQKKFKPQTIIDKCDNYFYCLPLHFKKIKNDFSICQADLMSEAHMWNSSNITLKNIDKLQRINLKILSNLEDLLENLTALQHNNFCLQQELHEKKPDTWEKIKYHLSLSYQDIDLWLGTVQNEINACSQKIKVLLYDETINANLKMELNISGARTPEKHSKERSYPPANLFAENSPSKLGSGSSLSDLISNNSEYQSFQNPKPVVRSLMFASPEKKQTARISIKPKLDEYDLSILSDDRNNSPRK